MSLYDQIHDVLERDWNPLGCRDSVESTAAYELCVPVIAAVLHDFKNLEQIVSLLHGLEVNYLNLDGDRERCKRVAFELAKLVEMHDPGHEVKAEDAA